MSTLHKKMEENKFTIIEKDLAQIADMLLLNGTLTECPGLVHGKMGITVFFFHYAKYTGTMLFADYAMDVLGEILNQIHVNSPADYEKGDGNNEKNNYYSPFSNYPVCHGGMRRRQAISG